MKEEVEEEEEEGNGESGKSTDSGKSIDSGYKSKREKTPDEEEVEVKTDGKIKPRWHKVSSVC